jgi:glyoxylase I family protein
MKLGTINHVALTVSDLQRSEAFYNQLLGFMGYEQGEKTEKLILWASLNGVITISPANPESRNQKCDRYSPGLHHLAFSADTREEVDRFHEYLIQYGVEILDPPGEYDYLPGYYAVYELPDVEKMACLVHQGSYKTINQAYAALVPWIEANGYKIIGANREVYIIGGNDQNNESYVTEVQFPVEKA